MPLQTKMRNGKAVAVACNYDQRQCIGLRIDPRLGSDAEAIFSDEHGNEMHTSVSEAHRVLVLMMEVLVNEGQAAVSDGVLRVTRDLTARGADREWKIEHLPTCGFVLGNTSEIAAAVEAGDALPNFALALTAA